MRKDLSMPQPAAAHDLSHFFFSSLDCMCIAGQDGYFKRLNPAFLSLLGYSEKELLAKPYLDFVHQKDKEKTRNEAAKLASGIPSVFFEIRFVCKSGQYKWLSWSCSPVGSDLFAIGRDISAVKRAENDLIESERRLRMVLENAPVALFTTDIRGTITLSVGKALEKIKLTQNEIVGKNIFELYAANTEVIEPLKEAIGGKTTSRLSTFNNTVFDTTYSPIYDQSGRVKEIIAVSVDVTEQRVAQSQELELKAQFIRQESEKKFRETFEHAGVGIAHVSFDGHMDLVNQEFCNALGYSKEELIGGNYFLLLAAMDVATSQPEREALFKGDIDKIVRERLLIKKDGSQKWMISTATAVRDPEGRAIYFILAHKDITQRKETENALRVSEENFRNLSETIPQIVWTTNAQGKIDYFNRKWYAYTGQSEDQDHSLAWQSALHPADVEQCSAMWEQAITSGKNYENERRFRRASDGEYRWHLGRALPIRNSQKEIIKWFGTCTDIHDQKLAEEEKSHALMGEHMAQENARVKTEFLATVSHEIRTPLNSVIGMSEILLDSSLDSDQYEYADTIRNSGEILLALINDVLDLSKIEAGRLILEKIDFNLKKIIHDVEQELAWTVSQKGIRLLIEVDPALPEWVNGDFIRTRQILSNLLSNAVKFTHEGQVTLRVHRVPGSPNDVRVRFEVEDTGIGISSLSIKSLFQPFTQVDSSMTRKYGGTGLGLSICKRLVNLMGSDIGVTSQLGKGSNFHFSLPFEVVTNIPVKSELKLPATIDWPQKPRVLVAEDLQANHKVITLFLEKMGCSARVVENGLEVLNTLEEESFDLILMDCQMPFLDGYQTSKAIRARVSKKYCNIPIIAITANAVSGDREHCLQAGMNEYLPKPIRFTELKMALVTCLNGQQAQRNSHAPYPYEPQGSFDSIDWSVIDEVMTMDSTQKVSLEIVSIFLKNIPRRLLALKTALKEKDMTEIKKEAHSLKSSSSYVGAKKLQKLCDAMRSCAESLQLDELAVLFAELLKETDQVASILKDRFPQITA